MIGEDSYRVRATFEVVSLLLERLDNGKEFSIMCLVICFCTIEFP